MIVGIETSDDAAIYKVTDDIAMIQTVDFFTPIVDDPYMFGQIAAANSLSDVYAMGGEPKAKVMCNIPLLDIPLAILDKYKGYPLCENKGTLLPVPCNQKANSYLKEIADFCGIKKNLTTHTGRHTFSTVVTLANNVSLENVSKMLSHTNTKMTQRYAKVLDQSILRDMQNVRENFSPKTT